jgi:hypothetical protein
LPGLQHALEGKSRTMITNYPVRKTKRHCLESIDLSLSTFDGESTTITFVRRNFGCSGPTWRVRKFKLIDITPASQQRLARSLDARPMRVFTMALVDVLGISFQATPKAYTDTRTHFFTFPKEPAP